MLALLHVAVYASPATSAQADVKMDLNAPGSARRPASSKSLTSASKRAQFRPWEQQDLLQRLHTFKTRTWFGKPSQINALVCARHGWINTGPDKLACEVGNAFTLHSIAILGGDQSGVWSAVLRRKPGLVHQAQVVPCRCRQGERTLSPAVLRGLSSSVFV